MVATWRLITRFKTRKTFVAVLLLVAIFLLSGGLQATVAYMQGAPTATEARLAISAPFIGGFILVGFFGFLWIIRVKGWQGLLGFVVVAFCYFSIDLLFQMIGVKY